MNDQFVFIYDPNGGAALRDGQVESYTKSLLDSLKAIGHGEVVIGCELVIQYIRVAIKQGEFPYENTFFKFGDSSTPVNRHGKLADWPRGFCDMHLNAIMKMVH